jgi:hypothetical protein
MTLVGYNNDSYDNPMLRYLMSYNGSKVNQDLYNLSTKLVSDIYRTDRAIMALRYPRAIKYNWKSIDLMRILAFDKLGISLKQVSINLKWHKIQDMPIHHTATLQAEEIPLVLGYNLNDVLITKRLYEEIAPLRKLREDLSAIYKIDLTSASDSRMANLILENIYSTELNMDIRAVRDMRTPREKVLLGDCIAKFVKFESPALNEMLDRISSTIAYYHLRYKYSEELWFAGKKFNLGVGGLHTDDDPGTFVSTDDYLIQDCDVASYYPNLIINNNFYPQHLGINFIKVLKKITAERIAAKKSGDKVKADGLKITINSIFGKLGSETFWLLDAKQMLSTTVSGQLGLLMLVEQFHKAGIDIISCNTDGIVCGIPKKLETKYYEIAKEWETATNLELEFTPYKKYVRRDVNSYITEKMDGKTKEKGAFVKEVDLKKSYHMPIVAKALYAYFIKGVSVDETLAKCKDIMEFCVSQKSGGEFGIELHTIKGVEKLQKTNRFFITTKGGALIKHKEFTNKLSSLYAGKLVHILNEYDSSVPFEDYHVDIGFYKKEVMKIIDAIEPKRMGLFDMALVDPGSKTKADSGTAKTAEVDDTNSVEKLNKLGSIQRSKRLEEIVNNGETIPNTSPRYVFISEIDKKSMICVVYSLQKGTKTSILIDKAEFKKNGLEKGLLVFCDRFERKEGASMSTLVKYHITEKIEADVKSLI